MNVMNDVDMDLIFRGMHIRGGMVACAAPSHHCKAGSTLAAGIWIAMKLLPRQRKGSQ